MKTTLNNVTTLEPNEIFIFGSNTKGIHGAGAALLAYKKFGAKYGQGEGLSGNSYALPTKDMNIETLPLHIIQEGVWRLKDIIIANPQYEFLLTAVGCGLAGYKPQDIAPLFKDFTNLPNISFPIEFQPYLI